MYTVVLILHIVIVVSLIGMILIQRGRSGGLVEALGGVESILGTKTSAVFVKITVGLAIGFFVTSVSLAYMSKNRSRSVMEKYADKLDNTTASKMPQANVNAKPAPGSMPVKAAVSSVVPAAVPANSTK